MSKKQTIVLIYLLTRTKVWDIIKMVKGVMRMKINERIMNVAGVILFYLVLLIGFVLINARMAELNETGTIVTVEK